MDKLDQSAQGEIDFENIFEKSPDLVCILDREHNIIRTNKAFVERVGISSRSLVGAKCFWCVHQRDVVPDFCPHSQLLKDGKEHTAELFIEQLGGWFSVTATPLLNNEGDISGSIHIARGITTRIKTDNKHQ